RKLAEPVAPFAANAIELLVGADLSNLAISFNSQSGVADVAGGNERRNPFFGPELGEFGFVGGDKIEAKIDIEPGLKFSALQFRDRLFEQLAIQIETDGHNVTALGGAENAPRTANLEIAHGDAK